MKNKILAMEAGPVLDQFVAEDVMGWKKGHGSTWIIRRTEEGDMVQIGVLPPFSTDIVCAWKVRDKMFDMPEEIRNKFIIETTTDIFHINPMMICKCALLAVMGL